MTDTTSRSEDTTDTTPPVVQAAGCGMLALWALLVVPVLSGVVQAHHWPGWALFLVVFGSLAAASGLFAAAALAVSWAEARLSHRDTH